MKKKRLLALFLALTMVMPTIGVSAAETEPTQIPTEISVEDVVTEEPVIDEPIVDEPVIDEPVVDEPVIDKPKAEEPPQNSSMLTEEDEDDDLMLMATTDSGTCGPDLTWTLDNNVTLTISGTGSMNDYYFSEGSCYSPWAKYRGYITAVEVGPDVTSVGKATFSSCYKIKNITIPKGLTSIGDNAFFYCDALKDVYYGGTEIDWNSISVGTGNEKLTNATIHFTDPCENGHTEVTIPGTPATETSTGLTDGIVCSVCGEVLKEQEEVGIVIPEEYYKTFKTVYAQKNQVDYLSPDIFLNNSFKEAYPNLKPAFSTIANATHGTFTDSRVTDTMQSIYLMPDGDLFYYTKPSPSSTEVFDLTISFGNGYEPISVELRFNIVNIIPANINGLTGVAEYEYDGTAKTGYAGTPVVTRQDTGDELTYTANDLTYTYYEKGVDGTYTEISSAPSAAGEYQVVLSLDNDIYYGSVAFTFTITQPDTLILDVSPIDITAGQKGTFRRLGVDKDTHFTEGDKVTLTLSEGFSFVENDDFHDADGTPIQVDSWSANEIVVLAPANPEYGFDLEDLTIKADKSLKKGTEATLTVSMDGYASVTKTAAIVTQEDFILTSGSLSKLLVEKLGVANVDTTGWESPMSSNVSKDDPYYNDMLIAYCMGWFNSTGYLFQNSDNFVDRQDLAMILNNAEQIGEPIATIPNDMTNSNYRNIICEILSSGVMSVDTKGNFNPYLTAYSSDINVDALKPFVISEDTLTLDLSDGSLIIKSTPAYTTIMQNDAEYRNTGNIFINQTDVLTANNIGISAQNTYAKPVNLTIANLNIETNTAAIRLQSYANVNLTLLGNNILTATTDCSGYGLSVGGTYWYPTLTIDGSGSLIIDTTKDSDSRAIYGNGANITINNGTILANSSTTGLYASGIDLNNSTLAINGGSLTASGNVAGIELSDSNSSIIVNGGSVTATGSNGIGNYGKVIVNSGSVTATGNSYAGIGGNRYTHDGENMTVTIGPDAKVTATGVYHAIGGGYLDNKYGCEAITISPYADVTLNHTFIYGTECQEIIRIDAQPLSSAALLGNSAAISVMAHGNSGLSYQWESSSDGKTWTIIDGQTTATLTTPVTAETTGWYYRCQLTNGWGNMVYTDAAQAFVLDFTQQPKKQDTGSEDTAALTVKASCDAVTYQWQQSTDSGKTWTDIVNGTASSLPVNLNTADENTMYRCVLTATNGDQLISDPVTLNSATEITYTIKYYLEKADGSGYYTLDAQSVIVANTGDVVSIPEVSYEHFVENTEKGNISGTVTADSSLELTRYYNRIEYEIIFDTNGGVDLKSLKAKYGTLITLPTASKYGYEFAGWYLDKECTEPCTYNKMPANGTTVYAKWATTGADRGNEYIINSIRVTDGNGTYITDKLPENVFFAEISVENVASRYMDTTILAAYDKDSHLVSLHYMTATSQIGQTVIFGANIDNTEGNIVKLKAFITPVLNGGIPVAKAVTFESEN